MGYFELVSVTYGDNGWVLRNITDEGLGHGTNRVQFKDSDPEVLVDRALNYTKNGPDQEILKAAAEVTALFKRRTLIQGDIISVLEVVTNDLEVEQRMVDMSFRYGRFDLETFYIGYDSDEEK